MPESVTLMAIRRRERDRHRLRSGHHFSSGRKVRGETRILFAHYRALVKPKEAERYWKIKPGPKGARRGGLGSGAESWQHCSMSILTIHLPEPLDATLDERVRASGAGSKEEYLLSLVESDCAAGTLERVLAERMAGPFAPLEPDWKDRVRKTAAERAKA